MTTVLVFLAGALAGAIVTSDDSPTKVAAGKPSTTTTLDVDIVPDGGSGPEGSDRSGGTSSTSSTLVPKAIPATTPLPTTTTTTVTASHGSPSTTTTTTKPGSTTTTTAPTQPTDPGPEPVRYPTGPADPIEQWNVYVVGVHDAAPHRVASRENLFDRAAWSADGRRIIYAVNNTARDVFTIKADGSERVALPAGGIEVPTWSSQGDLAVIEYDGVGHNLRINAVGGHVHVVSHKVVGPVSGRDWSPDGSRIAIIGGGRVWVADADGSDIVPITPEGKAWHWLEWSPDGTRIAYYESGRLKVVGADGSNPLDLAPMNEDLSFSWSPDSTELVVCAPYRASPRFGVGIVPAQGGPVRSLGVQGVEVSWSPDGKHIAYKAFPFQDNAAPLKLISPDGSNNRTFILPPPNTSFGLGLHWSPDSTHLLLNTGRAGRGGVEPPF